MKTKAAENFLTQVANKLKGLEQLQQSNHQIYSRPCERFGDSNGNESDQDILDMHIKTWDQSPGAKSPVPPSIPDRRPINSLDCANNNMPPPPTSRNSNPYATLPRRGPPPIPPKPTTIMIYQMLRGEIPTKTKLDGKNPTLSNMKDRIMKNGNFRYFCKVEVKDDFNVFQEIIHDQEVLPQFEGQVYCHVAATEQNCTLIRSSGLKAEVEYPMQKAIYRFNVVKTPTLREFKSCLPVLGNYR